MAITFRTVRHDIEGVVGTSINRSGSVNFSKPVRTAGVALNGFKFQYIGEDRPFYAAEADVDGPKVSGTEVSYDYQFLLRDFSGNIDDIYRGYVQVLVIADLKD